MAQSTAETEYIAAAATIANQAIWLRKILNELGMEQQNPALTHVDNRSAMAIANNPVQYGRTKHIKVKFHFLCEAEQDGEIHLVHYSSNDQVADIITKALSRNKFEELRTKN